MYIAVSLNFISESSANVLTSLKKWKSSPTRYLAFKISIVFDCRTFNSQFLFVRKYIAYATEPVIGSLANVLGDFPNDISKTQTSLLNVCIN